MGGRVAARTAKETYNPPGKGTGELHKKHCRHCSLSAQLFGAWPVPLPLADAWRPLPQPSSPLVLQWLQPPLLIMSVAFMISLCKGMLQLFNKAYMLPHLVDSLLPTYSCELKKTWLFSRFHLIKRTFRMAWSTFLGNCASLSSCFISLLHKCPSRFYSVPGPSWLNFHY